jgi:transcriptional regulator with XRE-family HTH domain
MARKWKEISRAAPEQREHARRHARAVVRRMKLDELRRGRSLSQEEMAEALGINQGAVSKIEHRADLYISTLRRFIHAVGGELRIMAQFPGGDPIEIELLSDIEPPVRNTARAPAGRARIG